MFEGRTCFVNQHEGRTGRISALGLDNTDRAKRGLYRKDRGPIFSHYGPEQAWLMSCYRTVVLGIMSRLHEPASF